MTQYFIITISFWTKFDFHKIILLLYREVEKPMASVTGDNPTYFVCLTNNNLTMSNSTDTVTIPIGKNIATKTWQSIGLTWKSNGELVFVVTGSQISVERTVTGDIPKL